MDELEWNGNDGWGEGEWEGALHSWLCCICSQKEVSPKTPTSLTSASAGGSENLGMGEQVKNNKN